MDCGERRPAGLHRPCSLYKGWPTGPSDFRGAIMTKTVTKTLSTAWAAAALSVLSLPSPTAHAQLSSSNAAAAEGLTEIVVTARRRTENLQDVPVAVTAIGAATIQTQ